MLPYLLRAKRFEQVQKFVARRRVGVFRYERTRSTPLDPKLMFWCVSYHFGAFGTIWLLTNLGAKRSRVGIFHSERTRSTPLDPKLISWCVSYYFGAFGTVWLPYRTRCKTGRSGAKVRAMKSFRNFSQRTHPIHPLGPLPHVLVHFVLFGCIWDSLLRYDTQFKTGQTGAKVRSTKSCRNFSQRTHPIHPIGL